MRQKLAAGNWKMNGTQSALSELAHLDARNVHCGIVIFPPAQLLIPAVAHAKGISIGAQNCHTADHGAHTGDLSASMIADTGARYVIIGHSERRQDHFETDALVNAKVRAAQNAGLTPIICVGETLEERSAGRAIDVIDQQLSNSVPDSADCGSLVIAYEPIWAIGTGQIPSLDDITLMHRAMRAHLALRFGDDAEKLPLLYGGSVKPDNAAAIFACPDVDGALVGGASLKAADFNPIIQALSAA